MNASATDKLWQAARAAGTSTEVDGCEVVAGRWPDGVAFEYRRPLNAAGRSSLLTRRADWLEAALPLLGKPDAAAKDHFPRTSNNGGTCREMYQAEIARLRHEAGLTIAPVAAPPKKAARPKRDWLRAACSTDEIRNSLMTPWHAPNGDHFATDCHRLHVRRQAGSTFKPKKKERQARPLDAYVPQREACDCGEKVSAPSYYGGHDTRIVYKDDCPKCAGSGRWLNPTDERQPVAYLLVIPEAPPDFTVQVNVDDLREAVVPLRKLLHAQGRKGGAVVLSMQGGQLRLYAANPDVGDAVRDIAAVADVGHADVKAAVNADYLLDALLDAEGIVTLGWSRSRNSYGEMLDSTLDPVSFTFADDRFALIMPIRA